MADIFLSYSSADRFRARTIATLLESAGWSVWMDRYISGGMEWNPELMEQLHRARCVVVLWTRDSIESEWVQDEAKIARERGVLLPLLLHPVTPPGTLAEIQGTPATAWIDESNAYELQPLLNRVGEFLGATAPILPTPQVVITSTQVTKIEVAEAVFCFCAARLDFFHERKCAEGVSLQTQERLRATYQHLTTVLAPVSSDELHELVGKHSAAYTPRDENDA